MLQSLLLLHAAPIVIFIDCFSSATTQSHKLLISHKTTISSSKSDPNSDHNNDCSCGMCTQIRDMLANIVGHRETPPGDIKIAVIPAALKRIVDLPESERTSVNVLEEVKRSLEERQINDISEKTGTRSPGKASEAVS